MVDTDVDKLIVVQREMTWGRQWHRLLNLVRPWLMVGLIPTPGVTTTGAWQIEEKDTVSNDDNMLLDDNSVLDEYITYVYGVNPADVSFRV